MSAKIKRASVYGMRIFSAALFVVLMLFNIHIAYNTQGSGDIDLMGIKISMFVPSAQATGGMVCAEVCYYSYVLRDCPSLGNDCMGCWIDGQWPPHCSKY